MLSKKRSCKPLFIHKIFETPDHNSSKVLIFKTFSDLVPAFKSYHLYIKKTRFFCGFSLILLLCQHIPLFRIPLKPEDRGVPGHQRDAELLRHLDLYT